MIQLPGPFVNGRFLEKTKNSYSEQAEWRIPGTCLKTKEDGREKVNLFSLISALFSLEMLDIFDW